MENRNQNDLDKFNEIVCIIKKNDLEKFKAIKNLNFGLKDDKGMTIVDWAFILGNQAVLNLIYERTIFLPGNDYFSLLEYSISCNQPFEKIKELYISYMPILQKKYPIDFNGTFLHIAVKRGNLEVVNFLIEKDVDVNSEQLTGMEWHSDPITPLYTAASNGHVEVLKCLIKKGASIDLDCGSITPLQIACYNGHIEIIRILFDTIIDKYKKIQQSDPNRNLSLFKAWYSKDWEDVNFLHDIIHGKITQIDEIKNFLNYLDEKRENRFKELAKMSDFMADKWNHFLMSISKEVSPYLRLIINSQVISTPKINV